MILDQITDKKHVATLCGVNKAFYALMMPRLHRRLVVAAEHYAQIPAMIRTVERYLSIRQCREIKAMGTYKGQQETYAADVDEDKVPDCVQFVQEIVIGSSSTGKKHDQVVQKYYEAVLGNLKNIQAAEAEMMRVYIAKAISTWKDLKSLSIDVQGLEDECASYFGNIGSLHHLCIKRDAYNPRTNDNLRGLVQRSTSTLKSLGLRDSPLSILDSESSSSGTKSQPPNFSSLRAIDAFQCHVGSGFVKGLLARVDLTQLIEAKFDYIHGPASALFKPLTEMFEKASQSGHGAGIKLRKLLLNANYNYDADEYHQEENGNEPEQVSHGSRFAFLASFTTLASLEITNYGMYPQEWEDRSTGFPDLVIDAILKHKGLRTLKISNCNGTTDKTLHLTVENLKCLVQGLPHLEHFVFSPEETHMEALAECLTQANLSTLTCIPESMYFTRSPEEFRFTSAEDMLQPILKCYLNYSGPEWEEKLAKIQQIQIFAYFFRVSPRPFPKLSKGMPRPRTLKAQEMVSDDGSKKLWYQQLVIPMPKYEGYDTSFEWMNMATGHD